MQCLGINNKIVYFHRQGKQVFLLFTKISTFKFVWIFFSLPLPPQRFSPGVPGAALWGTTSRHHQAQQCSLAEQPALTHTQLGSGFCATSSRQILPGSSSRRDRNEFETAVGLHALGWNQNVPFGCRRMRRAPCQPNKYFLSQSGKLVFGKSKHKGFQPPSFLSAAEMRKDLHSSVR